MNIKEGNSRWERAEKPLRVVSRRLPSGFLRRGVKAAKFPVIKEDC